MAYYPPRHGFFEQYVISRYLKEKVKYVVYIVDSLGYIIDRDEAFTFEDAKKLANFMYKPIADREDFFMRKFEFQPPFRKIIIEIHEIE